jgi:hypothetical protein
MKERLTIVNDIPLPQGTAKIHRGAEDELNVSPWPLAKSCLERPSGAPWPAGPNAWI